MKRTTYLFTLGLVALALAAGCVASPAAGGVIPEHALYVMGEGQVEVTPDVATATLGVETVPSALENSSTNPSTTAFESSRNSVRSTRMPSGAYAQPRLTSTAESLPGMRSGVMTCTPGDPFRERDVSTNSFVKS